MPPDEEAINARLTKAIRGIGDTTFKDHGHAARTVHAKSHTMVEGEMTVIDGLPEPLAQGLSARAGIYSAVSRFSCNPVDVLGDDVTAPRGAAIKVFGVDGERMSGSEGDGT